MKWPQIKVVYSRLQEFYCPQIEFNKHKNLQLFFLFFFICCFYERVVIGDITVRSSCDCGEAYSTCAM